MERLTGKKPDGTFTATDGHNMDEIISQLGLYEEMYEALCNELDKITVDMEKLRREDKTKTVTFKQLMANKFMVMNLIGRFDVYTK